MWALLAVYQALRTAVTDAVQSVPGLDPDRAGWQAAVETARSLVTAAANITGPAGDLPGDIGRAALASLHGPRRPRVCARKVKSARSRWASHPDGKPRTTRQITSIAVDIDARHYKPPKPKPTLLDKLRKAAQRGEPLDHLLKRLTPRHWSAVKQRASPDHRRRLPRGRGRAWPCGRRPRPRRTSGAVRRPGRTSGKRMRPFSQPAPALCPPPRARPGCPIG